MTTRIESIYQEFVSKFVEIIPVEWDKVMFLAQADNGVNKIHFVFFESASKEIKCYESLIKEYGIDQNSVDKYIEQLSLLVNKLQTAYNEDGLDIWNLMTFRLYSNKTYKVDTELAKLDTKDIIIRRGEWEGKCYAKGCS